MVATGSLYSRYSNIIPTGTSVSQWAFLDVTVSPRSSLLARGYPADKRTLPDRRTERGIRSWHTKLAVRWHHFSFHFISPIPIRAEVYPNRSLHTGSLEITAGVPGILGETPTATATGTRVPGLSPTQVSQAHGGSSSKRIAAITGGLLGGLAFLAAAVALLLWLARIRRRQQTRAAASVMFPGGAVPLKEKVAKRQSDDVFVQPKRDEAI